MHGRREKSNPIPHVYMSDLWYSLITLVSQYTLDVVTYKTSKDLRPFLYIKHPWYTNQLIKLLNFVKPDHVWQQSRAHHRRLWSDAWPEAPPESSSPPYARRASCPRWRCCLGSSGGSTWIDTVWQTREGCGESIQEAKCHHRTPIYPSTTRWWTTLVLCLTISQILMATQTHKRMTHGLVSRLVFFNLGIVQLGTKPGSFVI